MSNKMKCNFLTDNIFDTYQQRRNPRIAIDSAADGLTTNWFNGCPLWMLCTASIAMAYVFASILYIVITRFMTTPFSDSLTENQRDIKQKSSKIRGLVFGISFIVSITIIGCILYFMRV